MTASVSTDPLRWLWYYNERMMRCSWIWLIIVTALPACASNHVIPASLESQLDRGLTFSQLKESPSSYKGRLLVLGGETLAAKRLKEGTRVEVLQLPLDHSLEPGSDRTASHGTGMAGGGERT